MKPHPFVVKFKKGDRVHFTDTAIEHCIPLQGPTISLLRSRAARQLQNGDVILYRLLGARMTHDAKPLSAEDEATIDAVRLVASKHADCPDGDGLCDLTGKRPGPYCKGSDIDVLLATIDRQSEQLATARKALEWCADSDADCPHTPPHESRYAEDAVIDCVEQVATEAIAATNGAPA